MTHPAMTRTAVAVLLLHLGLLAALAMLSDAGTTRLMPMAITFEQDGQARSQRAAPRDAQASAPTAPTRSAKASAVAKDSPSMPPDAGAAPKTPDRSEASGAPKGGRDDIAASSAAAHRADGGSERQPMVDASFAGNRLPEYPAMSRRLGEQGVVALRVLITADGRASDVHLVRSSGSARLDQSAIDAIRQWRFVPALRGGKPISSWYEWQWEFRLH